MSAPFRRPLSARALVWSGAAFLAFSAPSTMATAAPADPRLKALEAKATAARAGPSSRPLIDDAERLAEVLQREGAQPAAAIALRYGGVFAIMADENSRALGLFERSAEICRRIGDLACLGRALNNAATAHQGLEGFIPALEALTEAAQVFARAGEPELAATVRFNAGNIMLAMDDHAGALSAYEAVERGYPGRGFILGLLVNKADALTELGRPADAVRSAERALALIARGEADLDGYLSDMGIAAQLALAEARAAQGQRDAALTLLAEARVRAARTSERDRFAAAHRCLTVFKRLDSIDRAVPCARDAVVLRRLEDERTRIEVLALAAEAYNKAGDEGTAYRLQREAFQLYTDRSRRGLTSAAARASADIGLAERNSLVSRLELRRAQERAELERTRLISLGILSALLIAGILGFARFRVSQLRRRQAAVLEERTRVARDLHDTLLQGFTSLSLQISAAAHRGADRHLEELARMARAILAEARNAVWQIRSTRIEAGDLRGALADWLGTQTTGDTELVVDLDEIPARLDEDVTEGIFRIVQEAVTNALLHADARRLTVRAEIVGGRTLRLLVDDDGTGFDAGAVDAPSNHWGLVGMRERVEALGGTLLIDSAPGRGARLAFAVQV